MTISGGLDGGSNPPAFQRAEIERLKKASVELHANDSGIDTIACQSLENSKQSSKVTVKFNCYICFYHYSNYGAFSNEYLIMRTYWGLSTSTGR